MASIVQQLGIQPATLPVLTEEQRTEIVRRLDAMKEQRKVSVYAAGGRVNAWIGSKGHMVTQSVASLQPTIPEVPCG